MVVNSDVPNQRWKVYTQRRETVLKGPELVLQLRNTRICKTGSNLTQSTTHKCTACPVIVGNIAKVLLLASRQCCEKKTGHTCTNFEFLRPRDI